MMRIGPMKKLTPTWNQNGTNHGVNESHTKPGRMLSIAMSFWHPAQIDTSITTLLFQMNRYDEIGHWFSLILKNHCLIKYISEEKIFHSQSNHMIAINGFSSCVRTFVMFSYGRWINCSVLLHELYIGWYNVVYWWMVCLRTEYNEYRTPRNELMSILVQNSVVTLVHSPYKIQLELKFLHLENQFACVYEMSLIYITSAPKSL